MNDNIVRPGFHPRPREARCTGEVPTHGDNFSPADSDTLSTMGLDASVWPHGGDYARRLRETRDRARSIAVALDCLARQWVEIDRELSALLGEEDEPA